MAQAYLEYARNNKITENTLEHIHKLLSNNNVYNYFYLPLSIMNGMEIQTKHYMIEYQWLDCYYTL